MASVKCESCCKEFSRYYYLKRHMIKCNKGITTNDLLFKCLENCQISFKTSGDLRDHLTRGHGLEMANNSLEFTSFEDFEAWRHKEEKKGNVRYFKARGTKRNMNNTSEKVYLYCTRTGKEKVEFEVNDKRSKRSQGCSKLNYGCTSQIVVTKDLLSNKCFVDYFSTHYGHEEEIQHLRISKQCRKEVSLKLMMGVSTNRILDAARENIGENLNRDDILTRKDISNIKKSFNIDIIEGCRHQDDASSVALWVEECRASTCSRVLFFKPQGESCNEFNLLANDFCLIFMNMIQIEIFRKFSDNIICIDGTHGMNAYDFELTTLLVIDEFGEGFPVSFMFSNRKDKYIYECFFHCIKNATFADCEVLPVCKTFMSDMNNVYYNAWVPIMGAPTKQLYCSWHVDRAWQQNLSKVINVEKRKWVYKTLKYLQRCLQEETFEKEFETFLEILITDKETCTMGEYLRQNYYNNRFQWGYCYRRLCGINTNMHLESMHKVLKYLYLEGKKVKRLDKAIHGVQKYVRDKTIDRIIKLTKGKCNEHLNRIKNRHRAAITNSYSFVVIEENNIFETSDNFIYRIRKMKENICCALSCTFCNICVHSFECTCLDYSVGSTICKHIHSLAMYIENIGNKSTWGPTKSTANQEISELVNSIPKEYVTKKSQPNNLLNNIKSEVMQLLTNTNSLNYTLDEQKHILKQLKVLNNLGSVSALGNIESYIPKTSDLHNKKIEKQQFFSTKKKRKPKNTLISKPNYSESKLIKSTLSQTLFVSDNPENDHLYL